MSQSFEAVETPIGFIILDIRFSTSVRHSYLSMFTGSYCTQEWNRTGNSNYQFSFPISILHICLLCFPKRLKKEISKCRPTFVLYYVFRTSNNFFTLLAQYFLFCFICKTTVAVFCL